MGQLPPANQPPQLDSTREHVSINFMIGYDTNGAPVFGVNGHRIDMSAHEILDAHECFALACRVMDKINCQMSAQLKDAQGKGRVLMANGPMRG